MRPIRLVVAIALTATIAIPSSALGWNADFFEKDASGNASYEEMAISPQAVFDEHAGVRGMTYLAYQGAGLDPHVIAFDHATDSWEGPYPVGSNDLRGDTHGAPALAMDQDGYIYVFYGGHLSPLGYSRSARPHDITEWVELGSLRVGDQHLSIRASYPQPMLEPDGAIRLYYRRDDDTSGTRGDWESVVSTGGALAPGWTEPEMMLDGVYGSPRYKEFPSGLSEQVDYYWYADFCDDGRGMPAFAAVRRDFLEGVSTDYYNRKGVYYAERSVEGTWTNAAGVEISPERTYASLQTTAAVLPEVSGEFTNQVVLRREPDGTPAVVYLVGPNVPGEPYEWRFARWSGDSWRHAVITETDDLFDAGTFEILPDGTIEAFLTTGGFADDQWLDDPATSVSDAQLAKRGGDISYWRSTDQGEHWVKVCDIITSPGPSARYNNPQLVRGHNDEARLLFSEWNNDASSFIHKVFLWGRDGFKQRAFTPKLTRLAGANRIGTAVEVSKQGFPRGASTAVLATAHNFPDALCGVPLAQAYRAPVLLCGATTLDPLVLAELQRLDVSTVIILGSDSAISTSVENSIKRLRNSRGAQINVERVSGRDRYATSVAIAKKLEEKRGSAPSRVVLASGENFPDALTVSPLAARRGYPVLLTPRSRVASSTLDAIIAAAPGMVIVVGDEAAVSAEVEATYAGHASVPSDRWGGPDRFATARIIAEHALAEGHTLERFVLATGDQFADAIPGGLLAARINGVLLVTPATSLHPEVDDLLIRRAFGPGTGVLDAFVLGGPAALQAEVENALAVRLTYLDTLSYE